MVTITRNDLQVLARSRLRESRVLLDSGNYSGSYHFAGVAVECALKACIARTTVRFEFPDLDRVRDAYNHHLPKLVGIAGLDLDSQNKILGFRSNWALVSKWHVDSRYRTNITRLEAAQMYKAIATKNNGIMRWIRAHW